MIRATLTTLALLATPLCAQPAPPPMPGPGGEAMPGHGPEPRPHHGPDLILRHLGLSADQEKAVHAALDRHRSAAMAREQEARDLEDRLHAAVGYEPTTPIEIGIPNFVAWYRGYHKIRASCKKPTDDTMEGRAPSRPLL